MPFDNWQQKLQAAGIKYASNVNVPLLQNQPIVGANGQAEENWVEVSTVAAISVAMQHGDVFLAGEKLSELITHRVVVWQPVYMDATYGLKYTDPITGTDRFLRVLASALADGRPYITIAYCRESPL